MCKNNVFRQLATSINYLFPILILFGTSAYADNEPDKQTFSYVQNKFCSNELNKDYKIADTFLIKAGPLFKHVKGSGKVVGLGYEYKTSSESIDFYAVTNLTGTIETEKVIDTNLSSEIEFLGNFKHKILEVHGQLRSYEYQILNMPSKGIMLISGIEYQLPNMNNKESELLIAKMESNASPTDIENAKHLLTFTSYYRVVSGLACYLK